MSNRFENPFEQNSGGNFERKPVHEESFDDITDVRLLVKLPMDKFTSFMMQLTSEDREKLMDTMQDLEPEEAKEVESIMKQRMLILQVVKDPSLANYHKLLEFSADKAMKRAPEDLDLKDFAEQNLSIQRESIEIQKRVNEMFRKIDSGTFSDKEVNDMLDEIQTENNRLEELGRKMSNLNSKRGARNN